MVRKKYTWRKMDAIFMYWPQFEQLVRDRLQSVLSRNVQLHIFEDNPALLFQFIFPLLFPQQIQLKQAEAFKSFLLFGLTISRDPSLVGLGIERAFVPEKVILSEVLKHRLLPACAFIIGA